MNENEKVGETIKTVWNSIPLNEQIEEKRETIDELFNDLVQIYDDIDLLYEFDKFKRTYEEVIKLYQMQAYRDGFKAGVLLFTQ